MYTLILKPLVPAAGVVASGAPLSPLILGKIRLYWLIFAGVGLLCLAGMLLYNKYFSKDTEAARQKAWKIMLGVYAVLVLAGIYFIFQTLFIAPVIKWKTVLQALIMLLLGGGGIFISLKKDQEQTE
jgi:hypothetical protein